MTTMLDHGVEEKPKMLRCERRQSNLYTTLVLALRDMRKANGRDETTGEGVGNESWIGLTLGMIVLDTLSGGGPVGERWGRLLTTNGVSAEDTTIIYKLRCSLLHGYGPPKIEDTCNRKVLLTSDLAGFAVDTRRSGLAFVSVPIFCGHLVERIANEAKYEWDGSLISTDFRI